MALCLSRSAPSSLLCKRCRAPFCSLACQKASWPLHKASCLASAALGAATRAPTAEARAAAAAAVDEVAALIKRRDFDGAIGIARGAVTSVPDFIAARLSLVNALAARLYDAAAHVLRLDTDAGPFFFAATAAINAGTHAVKASALVRKRSGVTFAAAFAESISDYVPWLNGEEMGALGAFEGHKNELNQLVCRRAIPAVYSDYVLGLLEHGSSTPQWACDKIRLLNDAFVYGESKLHGTGLFAARDFARGELLFDFKSSDEDKRAKRGVGLGFIYDANKSHTLTLGVPARVEGLLGTMNDAAAPDIDELSLGGERALRAFAAYTARSVAAANIVYSHPQNDNDGPFTFEIPASPEQPHAVHGFLNFRVAATRPIAKGDDLTNTYGELRWTIEAMRQAWRARSSKRLEALSGLAEVVVARAPDIFAAELGFKRLSDCGNAVFASSMSDWTTDRARLAVKTFTDNMWV